MRVTECVAHGCHGTIIEGKILPYIEPYISRLGGRPNLNYFKSVYFIGLLSDLEVNGYLPNQSAEKFDTLRKARNTAAHTHSGDSEGVDWQEAVQIAEQFVKGLNKAEEQGYKFRDEEASGPE